ncbi:hypothetical protein HQ520_07930 [bacterium]|nr:hypothetical protein [bacterium]
MTEFLELLWVLDATVEGYPEQAKLLEAIIEGDCFEAEEIPAVPAANPAETCSTGSRSNKAGQ